jgi:putative tricarboxylic transport membrane protein
MTTGSQPGDRSKWLRPALGETIIAVGVLALAGVVAWQTVLIPVSPLYAKVGPTVMPAMAALGIAVLGLLLLAAALTGGWQPGAEKEVAPDRTALLWVAAGLALNVVLIGPAGFTIASVILFACVARAFGSRSALRDIGIGAAFALVAYFGFAKTLGINIGSGLVEDVLERVLVLVGLGGG